MREVCLLFLCLISITCVCVGWKLRLVKIPLSIKISHQSLPKLSLDSTKTNNCALPMSSNEEASEGGSSFNALALLDPGTKGGLLVWSLVLTLGPLGFYGWYTSINPDSVKAGAYVGSMLVFLISIMWTFSYVFRVANKDTTYAKQLREYENAVLQKRLAELSDEEITTIVEEIEADKSKTKK